MINSNKLLKFYELKGFIINSINLIFIVYIYIFILIIKNIICIK